MDLVLALVLASFVVVYLEADKVATTAGVPSATLKGVASICALVAFALLSMTTGVLGSVLLTGVKLGWFALWLGVAAAVVFGIRMLLGKR